MSLFSDNVYVSQCIWLQTEMNTEQLTQSIMTALLQQHKDAEAEQDASLHALTTTDLLLISQFIINQVRSWHTYYNYSICDIDILFIWINLQLILTRLLNVLRFSKVII